MTPFGAAGCQYAATILRRHSGAKSVFVGALAAAGLKCTLHKRDAYNALPASESFRKFRMRIHLPFSQHRRFDNPRLVQTNSSKSLTTADAVGRLPAPLP